MKVYNITNTREFFNKLSACKGSVELVDENGLHLELTHGREVLEILPFSYMYGTIDQMELVFRDPQDCAMIVTYLMNKRKASA